MSKSFLQQAEAIQAKIDKLLVEKEIVLAKAATEVNPADVVAGAVVEFSYGKGDNKRTVTGTVVGVKPADPAVPKSCTYVKVAFGEGFEAQIGTITIPQITRII